ncbi:Fur family transcriptional regulator [Raineya sp.]|jgi:Fur family ferric uptake transcriptional regulator
MSNVADILTKHQLRHTDCRLETLSVFINKNFAISHNDLEEILVPAFDRVTLYRTLKTFLEKGIIHKVLDDEGTPKYALCSPHYCSTHEHHHNHVHFKCSTCGKTQCLDNTIIPEISLPKGFVAKEFNLLIQGFCNACSQR